MCPGAQSICCGIGVHLAVELHPQAFRESLVASRCSCKAEASTISFQAPLALGPRAHEILALCEVIVNTLPVGRLTVRYAFDVWKQPRDLHRVEVEDWEEVTLERNSRWERA